MLHCSLQVTLAARVDCDTIRLEVNSTDCIMFTVFSTQQVEGSNYRLDYGFGRAGVRDLGMEF